MSKSHETAKPIGLASQRLSRRGLTHAEILAGIAAQVVEQWQGEVKLVPHDCYEAMCPAHRHNLEQHRKYTLTRGGFTTEQDKGNVPVPVQGSEPLHDPSWDYVLPERYQG